MRKEEYGFFSILLEEAVEILKDYTKYGKEQHIEEVELMQGLGRVAAQDYTAMVSQPPFDRSPLDGYAVRSCDIENAAAEHPVSLQVVEEILAGDYPAKKIEAGKAARIMTGAPLPEGADCVVKQEDTDYGEQNVQIYHPVGAWKNVCFQGEDFKQGDCLIQKGTRISAIELGILASMGYATVQVYENPRIGIFTTGDELMLPGQQLKPGKIYNSNLPMLWGRLKELGVEPILAECLPDTEEGVAEELAKILDKVDLVITTGGVSVGKKDIMHEALNLLGADKIFWKVKLKPGTPSIFAVAKGVPIVALSGNPFGAITNLELLVRPILAQMTGDEKILPERKWAVMEQGFLKESKVRRFIRGIYRNGKVTLPEGLHSSGVLGSMQGCNCLIDIPAGNQGIHAEEKVEVILL